MKKVRKNDKYLYETSIKHKNVKKHKKREEFNFNPDAIIKKALKIKKK
jgi:hypothetical protein